MNEILIDKKRKVMTLDDDLVICNYPITENNKLVAINKVFDLLKKRLINPSGKFDSGIRFYAKNQELIDVREPSIRFPYSQLLACRTRKYVSKVYDKYECKDLFDLISAV